MTWERFGRDAGESKAVGAKWLLAFPKRRRLRPRRNDELNERRGRIRGSGANDVDDQRPDDFGKNTAESRRGIPEDNFKRQIRN